MKSTAINYLDFIVDKLTRSIENVATGDSFPTEISHLLKADLKLVTKKNGWLFDSKSELNAPEKEVYKLTIQGNPSVIQGLISISIEPDHIYMHLIESAPFNKGKTKVNWGFRATWLHMHAAWPFKRVLMDLFPFIPKPN